MKTCSLCNLPWNRCKGHGRGTIVQAERAAVRGEDRDELLCPTVHLNGTSRVELVRQYEEAIDAVRLAIQKLREAAPNARDFYVQGPSVIYRATEQHVERILKLETVRSELEALQLHIADPR